MTRRLAFALALSLTAAPALAAPAPGRPLLIPARDVTVEYAVQTEGKAPQTLRVAFEASGTRLRATLSGAPGALLLDRRAHRALLVIEAAHTVMTLPGGGHEIDDFLLNDRMSFERLDAGRVQNLPCTNWRARSDRGIATACVTADGVILRGEGHDRHGHAGTILATGIDYAPLPPATFEPPPGYSEFRIPHGLRGLLSPPTADPP